MRPSTTRDQPRRPSLVRAIVPITLFMLVAGVVGPIFLVMGLVMQGEPDTGWLLPTGIGITVLDIVIGVLIGLGRYRGQQKRYRLATNGRSARAQVLSADETNIRVNDQPLLALRLRIHGPDIASFEIEERRVVSEIRLPLLHAGDLPVLVDPETREWDFDWAAAGPVRSSGPVAAFGEPGETRGRAERLAELDDLLRRDLVSREEYDAARARILEDL